MSVSLWQREYGDGLGADVDTGVAIIGAGVCGLSAAVELRHRGVECVVIDRARVASGASGRNAGYLMRGLAESYSVACAAYGRERARAVWRWSEDNLDALRSLGVVDAGNSEARASCLVALDSEEESELRRSSVLLDEDGFDVSLIEPITGIDLVWRSGRPRVGLVNPNDAVCDPVSVVGRLGRAEVICDSEVYAIDGDGERVVVRGLGVTVRADRVLVCANAWIGELVPSLRGVITPKRGQMLAARPAEPMSLEFAYYLNRGNEYIRARSDGVVLVGGCRRFEPGGGAGDESGVHPAVQSELESNLRAFVTERYEVIARWSGVMGFSPSGLPIIGPTSEDERVWVCGGFTGHGMSLGHLAGRRAVAAMLAAETGVFPFESPADYASGSAR